MQDKDIVKNILKLFIEYIVDDRIGSISTESGHRWKNGRELLGELAGDSADWERENFIDQFLDSGFVRKNKKRLNLQPRNEVIDEVLALFDEHMFNNLDIKDKIKALKTNESTSEEIEK
jgi:hypothetical protein